MTVQSIDRVFDILELIANKKNGLNLTEVSNRLNLHKSTVYRLLSVLQTRGYIQKEQDTRKYKVGLGFIELCSQFLNSLELKTEAEPIIRTLSLKLAQTVYLAILQDNYVVYIDKAEQFNSLRKYSIIGRRAPLHCTALGKALLMGINKNEINSFFLGNNFKVFTKNTISTLSALYEELKLSKQRGWTFDNEEIEQGIICVAAPIYDYRDHIIAAVSTSWNKDSSNPNLTVENIADNVKEAAFEISKHMGYKR